MCQTKNLNDVIEQLAVDYLTVEAGAAVPQLADTNTIAADADSAPASAISGDSSDFRDALAPDHCQHNENVSTASANANLAQNDATRKPQKSRDTRREQGVWKW